MEKQIFRQKSIDRISSPEELNSYLKVSNVSVWLVLSAVIIFLAGLMVWASVGTLETKTEALVQSQTGNVTVYVAGPKASMIRENMVIRVNDGEYPLQDVSFDEYGRAVSTIIANLPDGKYLGEVVIESIKPISFLFRKS